MPIYDYNCTCGYTFEKLVARYESPAPTCPRCSEVPRRRPTGCALGGVATPGLSREEMPQTWRGTYGANTEYVAKLRSQWDRRVRLEERYPELRADDRPIISHEGRFEHAPLRHGDPIPDVIDPTA